MERLQITINTSIEKNCEKITVVYEIRGFTTRSILLDTYKSFASDFLVVVSAQDL